MSRVSAFVIAQKKQIIVILMALFYCIFAFQFFVYTDGFNPFYLKQFPVVRRYVGLFLLILSLCLSVIFAYFQNLYWWQKLKAVAEINLVAFFSFLYYAISSKQTVTEFVLFGNIFNFGTGLIAIPLIVLIFLTFYNSLLQNVQNTFLLLLQVFLLYSSIFSIDIVLIQDKGSFRGFNNIWFSTLFSIRAEVWSTIGLVLVSLLTVFWLRLKDIKQLIVQVLILFLINLELFWLSKLVLVNTFNLWHNAALMIIFWDFFYYLFRVLNKNSPSSDLQLRINLSFVYHFILIIILIASSFL